MYPLGGSKTGRRTGKIWSIIELLLSSSSSGWVPSERPLSLSQLYRLKLLRTDAELPPSPPFKPEKRWLRSAGTLSVGDRGMFSQCFPVVMITQHFVQTDDHQPRPVLAQGDASLRAVNLPLGNQGTGLGDLDGISPVSSPTSRTTRQIQLSGRSSAGISLENL